MIRNTKLLFTFLITFITLNACKGFLDINEDPNNPTEVPIDGLMINSAFETAQNTFRVSSVSSFFVQHLASPNASNSTDTHAAVSYDALWSALYYNLNDLRILTAKATEKNAPHYAGPAKIMMAYNLSLLVNVFGDVPYTQAFTPGLLQPEYDHSEDLYNEILSLITEALADLSAENSSMAPLNDDFFFGGNKDAWKMTAYALKARILNHLSKKSVYDPEAILSAVDLAFQSNADDFEMACFSSPTEAQNPWYRTALLNEGLNPGGWLSKQIVDQLNGTYFGVEDPRISRITDPATNENFPEFIGQYIGTRNGAGRESAPEQGVRAVLKVGSWYAANPTQVLEIITFSELKFIEAEAALASGDRARAYAAYESGIRAHMAKIGVSQDEIQVYWENPVVSVGAEDLSVSEIMKEKFIATFLNPESWNDARRFNYNYHGFQAPQNSALGGEMIRLARYPDSELQRNQYNVPDRTMLDRVFWDEE